MDILEILLVLGIALIVIGPDRLPDVVRALVKIMRELRNASNSMVRELSDALELDHPEPPPIRPTRRVGPPATDIDDSTPKPQA